jgi:hypothetical protein
LGVWHSAIENCPSGDAFSQLGHVAFSPNFLVQLKKNTQTPVDSLWSKKSLQQAKQVG